MLETFISIAIVAAIGAAAFYAADKVVTLRRDRDELSRQNKLIAEELEIAKDFAHALQLQIKGMDQRTAADIDQEDIYRNFRR